MNPRDLRVYQIDYRWKSHVRRPAHDGAAMELTGDVEWRDSRYHVVAPDERFARAAFDRLHSIPGSYEFVELRELVASLDDVIIPV